MKCFNSVKKYVAIPVSAGLMSVAAFPAFASDSAVVGPDSWASVVSGMTSQISVSTVVGVLASVIGAVMGLVFMWWGIRKVTRMFMSAFRSGKVSP